MGFGIRIGDLNWRSGIGNWERVLGLEIGDWDPGLGSGIGIRDWDQGLGLEIGDCDWILGLDWDLGLSDWELGIII